MPPYTYPRLIGPPRPEDYDNPDEYRTAYDTWQRTGGYDNYVVNLIGLKAEVIELNTLVGINTALSVQAQIDSKANNADLGTMSIQDNDSVNIIGGNIQDVSIQGGSLSAGTNISGCSINNPLSMPAGLSSDVAVAGGVLYVNNVKTYYVSPGQADLMSYTVLANILSDNNSFMEFKAWGSFASNSNLKKIRLQFGNQEVCASASAAFTGEPWLIDGAIVRNSTSSENSFMYFNLTTPTICIKDLTVNCAIDNVLKITGEAVNNNDILQNGFIIKWFTGV